MTKRKVTLSVSAPKSWFCHDHCTVTMAQSLPASTSSFKLIIGKPGHIAQILFHHVCQCCTSNEKSESHIKFIYIREMRNQQVTSNAYSLNKTWHLDFLHCHQVIARWILGDPLMESSIKSRALIGNMQKLISNVRAPAQRTETDAI